MSGMEIKHQLYRGSGPGLAFALAEYERIIRTDALLIRDIEAFSGMTVVCGCRHTPEFLVADVQGRMGKIRAALRSPVDFVKPKYGFWKQWRMAFAGCPDKRCFAPDMGSRKGYALARMMDAVVGLPKNPAYGLVKLLGLERSIAVGEWVFWTEALLYDDGPEGKVFQAAIPVSLGELFMVRTPDWLVATSVSEDTGFHREAC